MTPNDVAAPDLRAAWAPRIFFAGLLALVLGTIFVVLGPLAPTAMLPGVIILDVALLLLAAAGILRALARDA